jgi:DNA-binding CsgD family transcriptional regulator
MLCGAGSFLSVLRDGASRRWEPMKHELSQRELEVLRLAASGLTAKQTANVLGVSEAAVAMYLAKAERKLGAQTKAHAVAIATALELIGKADKRSL